MPTEKPTKMEQEYIDRQLRKKYPQAYRGDWVARLKKKVKEYFAGEKKSKEKKSKEKKVPRWKQRIRKSAKKHTSARTASIERKLKTVGVNKKETKKMKGGY